MNRNQARHFLSVGDILTHDNFETGKWIKLHISCKDYISNKGKIEPIGEFWILRKSEFWDEGWHIVNNIKTKQMKILTIESTIEDIKDKLSARCYMAFQALPIDTLEQLQSLSVKEMKRLKISTSNIVEMVAVLSENTIEKDNSVVIEPFEVDHSSDMIMIGGGLASEGLRNKCFVLSNSYNWKVTQEGVILFLIPTKK